MSRFDRKKRVVLAAILIIALAGSCVYFCDRRMQAVEDASVQAEEQEEKENLARKKRAEREAAERKRAALEAEIEQITAMLDEVSTDEALAQDIDAAVRGAKEAKQAIRRCRKNHGEELEKRDQELLQAAKRKADAIRKLPEIEDMFASLYDPETDQVVMNTAKSSDTFRRVQERMWALPLEEFPGKLAAYEGMVNRISEAWDFVNDEWHYETSTLRVSVEPKKTSYTKYWLCHVETFNPQQLCSALCGGTYGNPRVTTSREVAAHNGVIGINGSGFSYDSGIPAEGKSMIKSGKVYNKVYSNGNIMCVTRDGEMFTAIAGMTVKDMKHRGVWDTYCFGPTLVEDGKAFQITSAFQQTYRYQRTAIGMVNPGNYYILIVDGKGAGGSEGMTYEEMQKIFLDLDCTYAYNLDGGGSTTLVFKGRVINTLTDAGGERPCGDILYFIDAGDGGEGEDIVVHDEEAMLRPPAE